MKKRLISFVLVLIICFSLTGCANEPPAPAPETETTPSATTEPLAEEPVRTVLTFAYCNFNAYELWINRFNKSQDEYEIQAIDYDPNSTYETELVQQKLLEELAEGNGPDIISLIDFNFAIDDADINQYLEDLYPYLDSDSELSRENILQSYLSVHEVDGSLYSTIGNVSLETVVISDRVTENCTEWGVAETLAAAERVGGGDHLSCTTKTSVNLASRLMQLHTGEFVDLEAGTVDFDSEKYRQLLQLCEQVEKRQTTGTRDYKGVMYFDDLKTFYYPDMYADMMSDGFTYGFELGLDSYWVASSDRLAINSGSSEKEAAWDFIRVVFTPEYQLMNTEFPTNLDALETRAQMAREGVTEDKRYYVVDGKEREGTADLTPGASFDTGYIDYAPVSEDDIQRVMDLLNSTTKMLNNQLSEYKDIASLYANKYLSGKLTLDEAAAQAQSDAQTLLGTSE